MPLWLESLFALRAASAFELPASQQSRRIARILSLKSDIRGPRISPRFRAENLASVVLSVGTLVNVKRTRTTNVGAKQLCEKWRTGVCDNYHPAAGEIARDTYNRAL